MKITIAYLLEEKREADLICRFVHGLCPGTKVRKSDRHPPYKHIYLTTRREKELSSKVINSAIKAGVFSEE